MPTTTFHRHFHKSTANEEQKKPGRKPTLTVAEKQTVLDTLLRFSHRGHHMNRADLCDCIELLCSTFSAERKAKLPLKNGRPGRKFLKLFERRHREKIKFGKPSKQESKRFLSTNAQNLTTYFADLEATIRENHIDPSRRCNLDESGISPDRDGLGSTPHRRYGTLSAPIQQRLVEFSYKHRVTIMPVVFANGWTSKPWFVFKGTMIPYRQIDWYGQEKTETRYDCFPPGSTVKMRKEGGGIDKDIFIEWARSFVREVKHLTDDGRKVLLMYDAYRSHMSLQSLKILDEGNIIDYAIPAHTSGTTQPLDVGVFQPWKTYVNSTILQVCSASSTNVFDLFDLCKIMASGYTTAFTVQKICQSFEKAGLSPFNPMALLNISRPLCAECPTVIVSPTEMEAMLETKREERRSTAGIVPVVLKRGFVSTTAGLNLTRPDVQQKIKQKEEKDSKKREDNYKKMVLNGTKFAIESERRREERAAFERAAAQWRSMQYNEPFRLPRSMILRRKHAAMMAVMRRAEQFGMESLTFQEKNMHPGFNPSQDQGIE